MSRADVAARLGKPASTAESAGNESDDHTFDVYYARPPGATRTQLMTVEYELRDGTWMFDKVGGPHRPD